MSLADHRLEVGQLLLDDGGERAGVLLQRGGHLLAEPLLHLRLARQVGEHPRGDRGGGVDRGDEGDADRGDDLVIGQRIGRARCCGGALSPDRARQVRRLLGGAERLGGVQPREHLTHLRLGVVERAADGAEVPLHHRRLKPEAAHRDGRQVLNDVGEQVERLDRVDAEALVLREARAGPRVGRADAAAEREPGKEVEGGARHERTRVVPERRVEDHLAARRADDGRVARRGGRREDALLHAVPDVPPILAAREELADRAPVLRGPDDEWPLQLDRAVRVLTLRLQHLDKFAWVGTEGEVAGNALAETRDAYAPHRTVPPSALGPGLVLLIQALDAAAVGKAEIGEPRERPQKWQPREARRRRAGRGRRRDDGGLVAGAADDSGGATTEYATSRRHCPAEKQDCKRGRL
mmetsp:Transcript_23061/g.66046  ORF Transcript_23061/g.66046 Transcript_23061/m.66046 type:complete len:409 (-) Transcript_23061:45-1271(-)